MRPSVDTKQAILHETLRRLLKKIEDRGASPAMRGVVGGSTGLLVPCKRAVIEGGITRTVEAYELDTLTLRKLLLVCERARVLEYAQAAPDRQKHVIQ